MRELKKVLIVLLIALLLIGVNNAVLATDDGNMTIIEDEKPNNSTGNTNSLFNNANTNANKNTNTTTNTNKNNTNTNSSKYNNTNLPKAGSTDGMAVVLVIAVFGISALYAYKKIRDYNIK